MPLSLVTAPTAEPVSLVEAKLHLRVDDSDDDQLIIGLIKAARRQAEIVTRRQLVTATYRLTFDWLPPEIVLPLPPLAQVASITYVDVGGDTQTLATGQYTVDTYREPGLIVPAYNVTWPSTRSQINAVTVTFRAGFATPFTAVVATDVLTFSGRTFANGDIVRLTNSGGSLPTGLSVDTDYYVISVSGSTCKLSLTSGGSAVDVTAAGTGTHFMGVVPETIKSAMLLLVGHWYEHREAVVTGMTATKLPLAIESLLLSEDWGSYV